MQANLQSADPAVFASVQSEIHRQQDDLELIASENYVSQAVLETLGSPLTNKYAEGLPNRRYYGGCEFVDEVENIARRRARELFMVDGCDIGVNVQPHAGAQANQAVFLTLLEAGDTMLGLDLSHGGHLTHGSAVNSSGKLYTAGHYGVDENGRIDMDEVRKKALELRPKLLITGASAYPRIIDFAAFRSIADEVGAYLMADIAHIAGLVAAGVHPSPFPHCDVVTTTTHKTLRGPRGGMILAKRELMKSMNSAVFPGTQGGPLMHCIAAKAVAFGEALKPEFKAYCQQILDNASAMAERLMSRGFALVSDGTENHLMLIDLARSESAPDDLTGKHAEAILGEAGITVNKNTVPGEQRSPMVTSGVRIGTPAMTTRSMGVPESVQVADWIADVLTSPGDEDLRVRTKAEVQRLCRRFPIYPSMG
ncbi:MAG: serine hydroxymethyltransferase [Myxococcota bacterium]|nr:serine hydroxymethyltransferase [Myxococcota bacterium]MEC9388501.1 serine hydroxymethyltransferase [Myxococcota bacterium]